MFFTAYIGSNAGECRWRTAVGRYAAVLRMSPTFSCRELHAGDRLALAWIAERRVEPATRVRAAGDLVLIRSAGMLSDVEWSWNGQQLAESLAGDWTSNAIRLLVDSARATTTIVVPLATPNQMYWEQFPGGCVFADDVRFFPMLTGRQLDDRAVYALFQYGLIPPPLSIFRGVSRVPGGHVFELRHRLAQSSSRPSLPPSTSPAPAGPDAAGWVAKRLDDVLASVPESPVLYFSGGVDSTLLACRLVDAGRRDVQLINYAFGPEDQESRLALEIADALGLTCTRVLHEPAKIADVLERVGIDYSFPFGDLSTVPTNVLVHASLGMAPAETTVIEGTGADGAFGLAQRYPAWRRVYGVPSIVRRCLAGGFRQARLWHGASSPARLAGFIARSANLPLEPAVIAQNPLDGVAYRTPRVLREELCDLLMRPVHALSARRGEPELSLLDLTMVCAGTMAAKSFDPLRRGGFTPVYPYLDPALAYGASGLPSTIKCADGVSKSVLKALVAADMPRAWVYRPKSGFTPPYGDMFASAPLQQYLQSVALDSRNPLLAFCEVDVVRDMVTRARRRQTLSPGVNDFLWSFAFASGWLAAVMSLAGEPVAT